MDSVQLVLIYGPEVWADALSNDVKVALEKLTLLGRSVLRVSSANRKVSEPAVLSIAGVIPVAFLAKQR